MQQTEIEVSLLDMVMCLSSMTDLISPAVANHQQRVAYVASRLAAAIGLDEQEQLQILVAGALHDIGGLSLAERLAALDFETQHTALHAQIGATLVGNFPLLSSLADFILHHHTHWDTMGEAIPLGAQLIHLADRVDVLMRYGAEECLLTQVAGVCRRIEAVSGRMFNPELVAVLLDMAKQESFWLDLQPTMLPAVWQKQVMANDSIKLGMDDLLKFAQMISQVIDFRSRFTATHSSGVSASAKALGQALGYDPVNCRKLRVAGYLHDLGKLAIPGAILEKPGALTATEYAAIRSHTYYTYRSLQLVRGLDDVAMWAAYHHERLDGTGYPFRLSGADLCQESRIMAVADVYTAVSENRPYRGAMQWQDVQKVLTSMAQGGALDASIVDCLFSNRQLIEAERMAAQELAVQGYESFWQTVNEAVYFYSKPEH